MIECLPTGALYVGASARVYARWRSHLIDLRRNRSPKRLQSLWNAHGRGAFRFTLIESCALDVLTVRELAHFERLQPSLNTFRPAPPNRVRGEQAPDIKNPFC